jgi:hypothetical protein
VSPDAGPHADDPELRSRALALLLAVAADPDADTTAEHLGGYLAAVDRRRAELRERPAELAELERSHALVILDGAEAIRPGAWERLDGLRDVAEDVLRDVTAPPTTAERGHGVASTRAVLSRSCPSRIHRRRFGS